MSIISPTTQGKALIEVPAIFTQMQLIITVKCLAGSVDVLHCCPAVLPVKVACLDYSEDDIFDKPRTGHVLPFPSDRKSNNMSMSSAYKFQCAEMRQYSK